MWGLRWLCVALYCITTVSPVPRPRYATTKKAIYEPGSEQLISSKSLEKENKFYVEINTNNSNGTIHVNGRLVWWHSVLGKDVPSNPADPDNTTGRGLFLVVLHPVTGHVQGEGFASGWMMMDAGHSLRELVRDCRNEDVLLFFTIGEIGPGLAADEPSVRFMTSLGAKHFQQRGESDMYSFIKIKGGDVIAETYIANEAQFHHVTNQHKKSLQVGATVPASSVQDLLCPWKRTPKSIARAKFCFKYDGYGDLCDCTLEELVPFSHEQLKNNNLTDVPIAIVASNRPKALFRSMRTLLQNRGIILSNIIVYVDGEHPEVAELCELLDIKCVSQTNDYRDVTFRIREHYRLLLTDVWQHFPSASRVIVLEEDLEVSPDFVSYFSQTSHLLDADPSLWCISAWNDNGFEINSSDPALLYRIEYMPGLGWMMKKSVIQELLGKWPPITKAYDWDVWVRWDINRLGRECIIPDVSRTFHFGISGRHSTSLFHALYYSQHALNTQPDVTLRGVEDMTKERYEVEVLRLIAEAETIHPHDFTLTGDVTKNQGDCELELESTGKTYAIFFAMENWSDTTMYKTIARCMRIWDLDVRGHHSGLWRFSYEDNNILAFGVPVTTYMNDVTRLFKHPVNIISQLEHF